MGPIARCHQCDSPVKIPARAAGAPAACPNCRANLFACRACGSHDPQWPKRCLHKKVTAVPADAAANNDCPRFHRIVPFPPAFGAAMAAYAAAALDGAAATRPQAAAKAEAARDAAAREIKALLQRGLFFDDRTRTLGAEAHPVLARAGVFPAAPDDEAPAAAEARVAKEHAVAFEYVYRGFEKKGLEGLLFEHVTPGMPRDEALVGLQNAAFRSTDSFFNYFVRNRNAHWRGLVRDRGDRNRSELRLLRLIWNHRHTHAGADGAPGTKLLGVMHALAAVHAPGDPDALIDAALQPNAEPAWQEIVDALRARSRLAAPGAAALAESVDEYDAVLAHLQAAFGRSVVYTDRDSYRPRTHGPAIPESDDEDAYRDEDLNPEDAYADENAAEAFARVDDDGEDEDEADDGAVGRSIAAAVRDDRGRRRAELARRLARFVGTLVEITRKIEPAAAAGRLEHDTIYLAHACVYTWRNDVRRERADAPRLEAFHVNTNRIVKALAAAAGDAFGEKSGAAERFNDAVVCLHYTASAPGAEAPPVARLAEAGATKATRTRRSQFVSEVKLAWEAAVRESDAYTRSIEELVEFWPLAAGLAAVVPAAIDGPARKRKGRP